MEPSLRSARPEDAPGIRDLLAAALPEEDLLATVEGLRSDPAAEAIELVAVDPHVAGHVIFSRVTLEGAEEVPASILAPLCVVPKLHGRGLGSALVRKGLDRVRARGDALCLVYGDPDYYGRFGFRASAAGAITPPHELHPDMAHGWQALWLGAPLEVACRVQPAEALRAPELW